MRRGLPRRHQLQGHHLTDHRMSTRQITRAEARCILTAALQGFVRSGDRAAVASRILELQRWDDSDHLVSLPLFYRLPPQNCILGRGLILGWEPPRVWVDLDRCCGLPPTPARHGGLRALPPQPVPSPEMAATPPAPPAPEWVRQARRRVRQRRRARLHAAVVFCSGVVLGAGAVIGAGLTWVLPPAPTAPTAARY